MTTDTRLLAFILCYSVIALMILLFPALLLLNAVLRLREKLGRKR